MLPWRLWASLMEGVDFWKDSNFWTMKVKVPPHLLFHFLLLCLLIRVHLLLFYPFPSRPHLLVCEAQVLTAAGTRTSATAATLWTAPPTGTGTTTTTSEEEEVAEEDGEGTTRGGHGNGGWHHLVQEEGARSETETPPSSLTNGSTISSITTTTTTHTTTPTMHHSSQGCTQTTTACPAQGHLVHLLLSCWL